MASVSVGGKEIGRCDRGLLLLVGVHRDDDEGSAKKLAQKISTLRIFNDVEGKMNLSIQDFPLVGSPVAGFEYNILAVSNFTVWGDASKSRRPSFMSSAGFEQGSALFNRFVLELRGTGIEVQIGEFGADMQVAIINDGPVTLIVDA